MHGLLTVAKFTVKDMVKRKSYIISNIIILLLIVVGFNVPNILSLIEDDEEKGNGEKILIVDNTNVFEDTLSTINEMELGYNIEVSKENVTFEEIKQRIENEEIQKALVITKENNLVQMEYIAKNLLYVESVPENLVSALSTLYTNIQISKLNLSQEEIEGITPKFDFKLTQTEEQEVEGNPVVMMLLSLVLFYAIYFCAYQVSSSITTEKTSKIIETLVTSTKPSTIVLGKTIGIGVVGLMQVLAMIIVALICSRVFLPDGTLSEIINLENMTPFLLVITLVYFILGYFSYAFLYALTGSTVSKPEDVQSANGPVAILAVIGFYLAYFTMMNPTSGLNKIAAIVPISSPFCMPFRVMMGIASIGDIAISVLVLLATIFVVSKISIKIYSSAILNYGTKMSIKDILTMYKDKNN